MADTELPSHAKITLLGVPIEIGAAQPGTLMGPAALRTAGIARVLEQLGHTVEDHGDMVRPAITVVDTPPANARYYDEVRAWVGALGKRAFSIACSGAIPIFMGGDHSLAMGSVNGVARYWQQEQKRPLFVLWLDAHADYNTPATTLTGNMHGMSAAFLCGEPGLDGLLGGGPRVSIAPDQLDLFGIRSIDPLEKNLVRDRRIAIADMRAIDEFGVGVLIRRVVERVRARNGVLHLSFDIDFLDPAIAPGVGTTVQGGATYREAHLIMELLHDSGLIRSADIVELNPFLDERGRTARVAVELIGSLFGLQITDRATPSNAVLPD
ncbi:MAG: arginase [Bradyrhizobium sp.]|uniref:arginase n=1 Tax=Bradyrhizobium sp. TaxID=376 RepID=UPI001C2A131F|nr:arginase [Bradyrhizobium sp.]MBU6464568.1 arginase [Pseudomonadota bacterium]MDE2069425.1 arginase [Bradyrhizobium sp.]MDE2243918.1 arginase [Bradyrhizobium sp.]MDE2473022.1 arginase [Bradyrhizobium sp.]